ncbi:protein fem-1 homolog A [Parasteatoda tepidariorum]|uniref:protein fem-1 homolog A n=1 Tax=Parasteatoda tepidariorum TaxID=114398 RepID=UPI00077F90F7|nr:protein fem-1 homolog A [Parasteatoda tepidariorum]
MQCDQVSGLSTMPTSWIKGKSDLTAQKELTFTELHTECRLAAPGSRLSYSIRSKLERFLPHERFEIVSYTREGCAPLFIASKKGNVEIVEYLIEVCGASVEQRGMYEVPDDRSKHYVTPLWCASVAGKLSVVKCLVEHGADVDSVSDTGSTPVRSACFMTHYEIVVYLVTNGANILKPNFNGGTCLINSVQSVPLCEFLIRKGADVNAQDIQLKTALHYAIQEHRIDTAKLLLENGADPLIKSRYGDDALQTACLKSATHVFDYLIDNYTYSRERIAEAHELMGSTFLEEHHDIRKALHYWRTALMLRYENPIERLEKPKTFRKTVYLYATEFTTMEELENLVLDLDQMRMQSLIICERILGPLHRDMIFRLMYRGAAYADSLQYLRCIDLWKYALDLRIQKDTLLHSEVCFAAQALVRLFLDLYEKNYSGVLREKVEFQDVVDSIRLVFSYFPEARRLIDAKPLYKRHLENFDKVLRVMSHLLYVLHVIPKTDEQLNQARLIINEVLVSDPRGSSGESLLHMVVSKSNAMKSTSIFDDPSSIFPDPDITEMFLQCGADVDCVNHNLSTPLHVASLPLNFHPQVVEVLLRYGAHIDRRNSSGHHPHQLLQSIPECGVNHLNYISLKCLAARKVMEKQIHFLGEVPVGLEEFIRIH